MAFPRWSPLLVALTLFSASACNDKPGPGEPAKPDVSAAPAAEVSLKEVDTTSLTPRERREWAAQVSELLAPCPDVPVSIAQCVKEKRACKTCLPAAQLLLKQVQAGRSKKEREEAFHARFDPKKVNTIATEGSPEKGAPDAVVTIVEWADFECSACRVASPLLDEVVKRFEGQVRLVFKNYPLPIHPHGELAARAGIAAQNQGKFWEMHHIMFENQERLEQADLEKYAKQVGLDAPKYRVDFTAKQTTERIEKDKKQADELGLDGTPMIFINGRKVPLETLTNPYEDLEDWVKLDIELAGKTPRPAPPKGSASPTAGAGAAPDGGAPPDGGPEAAPTSTPTSTPTGMPKTTPTADPKKDPKKK
jgi:protein-disulfide isomerase